MVLRLSCSAVLCVALLGLLSCAASAQSSEERPSEQQRQSQTTLSAKGTAEKIDEFAEAARILDEPASHPECVWLGRRAVNLLWGEDPYTAFLDMYDRFGCPREHMKMAFQCVIRQGRVRPKAPESVGEQVHACWINPNVRFQAGTAPGPRR